MRSILTVSALMLVLVVLPVRAMANNCLASGQHLSAMQSHSTTVQPNVSASISSGDLEICVGSDIHMDGADCRIREEDNAGALIVSQLGLAVRWMDGSGNTVGAISLPLTGGPVDQVLVPNMLFLAGAFSSVPPRDFQIHAVAGAFHITARCTAVLTNQSSFPSTAKLAIGASYVGH